MDKLVGFRAAARILMFCVFLSVLCGCAPEEPRLQILYDHGLPQRERQPVYRRSEPPSKSVYSSYPRWWVPPAAIERKWTAIVIHHSATETGDAAVFDREHREQRHWEGVGYDFVIGNGTDSGDGEVEVTFRWKQQKTGAHCKTPNNWANEVAVGICLVGDFTNRPPTVRQMRSLEKLVEFLQKRYGIRTSRIFGHKNTPGAHVTECPGRYFPMSRLKSALAF